MIARHFTTVLWKPLITGAGGATKTLTGAEASHQGDQQTPSETRTDTSGSRRPV